MPVSLKALSASARLTTGSTSNLPSCQPPQAYAMTVIGFELAGLGLHRRTRKVLAVAIRSSADLASSGSIGEPRCNSSTPQAARGGVLWNGRRLGIGADIEIIVRTDRRHHSTPITSPFRYSPSGNSSATG